METLVAQVPYLRRRRIVELPDSAAEARSELLTAVAELRPDVLLHVTQQDLRTDELDLLEQATREWQLGPLDVVVVLLPASRTPDAELQATWTALGRRGPAGGRPRYAQMILVPGGKAPGDRFGSVRSAVADLEPFVEARRAREVLRMADDLGGTGGDDERGDLRDALERLALSPTAHAMRERWALEESISGRARLGDELREDLLGLYLPSTRAGARAADRAGRATRWQAEVNHLPPLAAEVGRVAVRSYRMRAVVGPSDDTPEVQHVHA
jgi:hypothetical protein